MSRPFRHCDGPRRNRSDLPAPGNSRPNAGRIRAALHAGWPRHSSLSSGRTARSPRLAAAVPCRLRCHAGFRHGPLAVVRDRADRRAVTAAHGWNGRAGGGRMRPLPRRNRGRRISLPVSGMLAVAVWLAVGGGGAAAIGQPERAARAGMAAYRGGDFETAASAFTGAAELRPGNAGLLYNAGAAAYRLGSYGAARRLLQASINGADDDRLAAAGHLAVGHSWMAEAEQLAQTDPAAVPAALEAAIKSYERTLRLNGDRVQAAYHLERARAMLDELRRQMAQDSTDSQDNGSAAAAAGTIAAAARAAAGTAGTAGSRVRPGSGPAATGAATAARGTAARRRGAGHRHAGGNGRGPALRRGG